MKKFFSFIVLLSMFAFTTSAQNSKDVNADGLVDIGDVTSIIDCLLNPSSADSYRFISINGECNHGKQHNKRKKFFHTKCYWI